MSRLRAALIAAVFVVAPMAWPRPPQPPTKCRGRRRLRAAGLTLAAHPLGGAALPYWEPINFLYKLSIAVVNPVLDPAFSFITVDHDGKIRIDPSNPFQLMLHAYNKARLTRDRGIVDLALWLLQSDHLHLIQRDVTPVGTRLPHRLKGGSPVWTREKEARARLRSHVHHHTSPCHGTRSCAPQHGPLPD